jgi:putative transposase
MKNRILLDNYYLPGQLEHGIAEFVAYYNNRRYQEPRQPDLSET